MASDSELVQQARTPGAGAPAVSETSGTTAPRRRTAHALVIGARGAVGRAVTEELVRTGHRCTEASRSAADPAARIDLSTEAGLAALAAAAPAHDVIVNASGWEVPEIGAIAARSGTPLVDISASGAYLTRLRDAAAGGNATVVLGAGIAPGLSTTLVAALLAEIEGSTAVQPGSRAARSAGARTIDVAVTLGSGEVHGPAAIEWTAGLAGRRVFGAPEGDLVLNLREGRTLPTEQGARRFLRADFPDQVLLAADLGAEIRSYLATGSRVATAALALVGRFPALRGMVARAPHWGDERWEIRAIDRASGASRTATGSGQSRATGVIAAHAAAAAASRPALGPVAMTALLSAEQLAHLPGITVLEMERAPRRG